MEYIIYGTDEEGQQAHGRMGPVRVRCFADRNLTETEVFTKPVLSLQEMAERYRNGNSIVVAASPQKFSAIEKFLQEQGMDHAFAYSPVIKVRFESHAPNYMAFGKFFRLNWAEVLMRYQVNRYQHIAVCANEEDLPYLMSEIAFQCDAWTVDYILSDTYAGLKWMGVPVVRAEDAFDKIDGLVIAQDVHDTGIRGRIPLHPDFAVMDLIDISRFVPAWHHPELARFKDIHKGERCFIIGNGPSLRMEDLDQLADRHIPCFAVNKIYLAFGHTKWRPDYLCVSDPKLIALHDEELDKTVYKEIFYDDTDYHIGKYKKAEGVNFFHMAYMGDPLPADTPRYSIKFSDDITICTYNGRNSIYESCLPIATYMGFKEIYLLGTDCSYAKDMHDPRNHFIKTYSENSPGCFVEDTELVHNMLIRDYEVVERYSHAHGFRVFNATRGGALEVFERVDFDELMKTW